MINLYKKGQKVRCSAAFTVNNVATDPTTITFKFMDPSRNVTAYVYGTGAEVVRTAAGAYYVDVTTDEIGEWSFRFEGTGTCTAVEEASFNVTTAFP